MAFRLVKSYGDVNDPAMMNLPASGVVTIGGPVALVFAGTGGAMVEGGVGVDTTKTALFGVSMDYAQGASDTFVRVIPFDSSQLWDVDTANAVTTAQIGIRQYLSATRGYIHNQVTDLEAVNRVFLPVAIVGATTGSGRLLGHFLVRPGQHS